jgi:protein-disulfide isomerase
MRMQSENDRPPEWRPFPQSRTGPLLGGPPLAGPVDELDHTRGESPALVTLVEYADFECLNCARAFPLLVRLLEEFNGTLRLVFRHFPLGWEHPASALAARAAEAAARQGKFWEMHDELFRNPGMLHREALHAHAASVGLDLGRFASDLDEPSLVSRIERDVTSGRASSVNATPTFFIDGARYANSRYVEGLRDAIFEAAMRSTHQQL